MAMAECPVNEELHPFFRQRPKEDADSMTQVAKQKSHEQDSQPPKQPAKIPAMFLQQQSTKGNTPNDNQHKQQRSRQRQLSPSSPLWPDSDYYYGDQAQQTHSQGNGAQKMNVTDSDCDYNRKIPSISNVHTRRAKIISKDMAHSYFKLQRDNREIELKSKHQSPHRQPIDLQIPLLTRSSMIQLLNTMYPNGWQKSSFLSLFDYLYPVPSDGDGLPTQDPRFIPWRDKYRPLTIDGLVGNPENCTYLRDWLLEMKVSPIAAPFSKNPKVADKSKLEPNKTKRKLNIPDDLQDFIVDSDEEMSGFSFLELLNAPMFDFDDNDEDFQPDVIHSRKPRKQDSKNTKKMEGRATSNLILLVGDHGTGKTAAVYTAASEVGYDVFEINAGQKRNAKEILAIVGEMAESHQVSFENVDRETFDPFASFAKQMEVQAVTSTASDHSKAAKSDQPALDTGKRKRGRPRKNEPTTKVKKPKSMAKASSGSGDITRHFLRMNVKSVSPPPDPTILVVDKQEDDPSMIDIESIVDTPDIDSNTVYNAVPTNTPLVKEGSITTENQSSQSVATSSQSEPCSQIPSQDAASSETRSPRQSLILLEEVDILYDEDKTFWSGVINLAQKSKRPIIMTCNDIRMVPYEVLALQATLQFDIPDIEEITQYLQLVCLAEGHLIDPSELYYLCIIFGHDLRKLLNSLELWSRKQLSNNDRSSLYVHRCLIEKIIGRDETFNSHVATIMQQRQEMYLTESDEVNVDMDDFAAKIDTLSFVDGFCHSRRANQMNEIDEYGPSKDNTLGHKFIWKVPSDYDHWDIDDRIVKAACSLNEKVLPDLGTAIGRNGTMATLGNHNVQSCITTLFSFRTKVQCEEQVATEYIPFVLSICKSDNAMLMAQALPAPGQLRSMRRRGVRRHLSQITHEQSCQIENDLQLEKPVLASSIGKDLHTRFEEAIRSNLTTE